MLPDWLIVVILGIVEGITEFIPVSSTGHLLLAGHFLQRPQSDLFYILIQSGAVLAVIPLFRERIAMLLRWREPESRALNLRIFVAFAITCAGGIVLKKLGFKLPEDTLPIALALIVGGAIFIAVERLMKGTRSDRITWTIVFVVAGGQLIAAAFPGASRSGSTIILAMIFGATRVAATEFSFLVGIPTMLAAGALETYGEVKDGGHEDWGLLALGFVVSAIVSFIAVKWLLRYVQSHTFVSFGIYRIALGVLLLILLFRP
jgi:undecaprenyl-diphosphatase